MTRIDKIQLKNFKFFQEQDPIELKSNHLLLYGENGSGKSSIYWALYTLFEAAAKKEDKDITKYFMHSSVEDESLVNIYAEKQTTDGKQHYDSFVKLTTDENPQEEYEISYFNTSIRANSKVLEILKASDFINYKVLFKFQDFYNGEKVDLAKIFIGHVLPYVNFSEGKLLRKSEEVTIASAIEMWQEIKEGPGRTKNKDLKVIQVYKNSPENQLFEKFVSNFHSEFESLIDFININAPKILKELGYSISFYLKYNRFFHKKADVNYICNDFSVDIFITSYNGEPVEIKRPQSFFNEAKFTAIAMSIRLSILKKRINKEVPNLLKFIVFDDVMISLDMNNRDKFMDYILNPINEFTKDYQLLFLTHDKNLYDFIFNKIKLWDNAGDWVFKEMFTGKDKGTDREYPIIMPCNMELIDKAKKQYEAKDYTACAIYLRKELERIISERLPIELKSKVSEKFIPLETLWERMIARYSILGIEVDKRIKFDFNESKLHILNPQAHYQNISLPVYKNELDKVFKLIEDIEAKLPIPKKTLLINKESTLTFKYQQGDHDYTIEFELTSDFFVDEVEETIETVFPKCKVLTWFYNGQEFWDFNKEHSIVLPKPMEFNKIQQLVSLVEKQPLGISKQDFENMTIINNGLWSLKEILDKANVIL